MSRSFFSQFKLSRRSGGAKRKVSQRRSHGAALGRANLGLEQLEARMMLSASNPPVLLIHGPTEDADNQDFVNEASPYTINWSFFENQPAPEAIEYFTVDWKDGTVDTFTDPTTTSATHIYNTARVWDPDLNGPGEGGARNFYAVDVSVKLATDLEPWHYVAAPDTSSTPFSLTVNDVATVTAVRIAGRCDGCERRSAIYAEPGGFSGGQRTARRLADYLERRDFQ